MTREPDEITNSADVIDSRDIIARIEYLEQERASLDSQVESLRELLDETSGEEERTTLNDEIGEAEEALRDWDESDEARELAALKALAEQCEGYGDWRHGAALIRESYFEDYAQQLAEDLGYIKHDAQWPYTCIDWAKAARDLQMDYTTVDFDGVEYLMRS